MSELNQWTPEGVQIFEGEPGAFHQLTTALHNLQDQYPDLYKDSEGALTKTRNFYYVSYSNIVKVLRKAFNNTGIMFNQLVHSIDAESTCVTLVVSGYNATIMSTHIFKNSTDARVFGAELSYRKRYQLKSFFNLEGDEDADESSFQEYLKSQKDADTPKEPTVSAQRKESPAKDSEVQAKETSVTDKVVHEAVEKVDQRDLSTKLIDAFKFNNWSFAEAEKYAHDNGIIDGSMRLKSIGHDDKSLFLAHLVEKGMVPGF
jgi:hypothetical protein